MSTVRIAERRRWATIANETLDDDRLSFRARGILAWLLSKPDGWTINSIDIAKGAPEGRDAVRTALGELEKHGYLVREVIRGEGGKLSTISTLYESPNSDDKMSPAPRNPASVDPASVFPAPESNNREQVLENSVGANADDAPAPSRHLPVVSKVSEGSYPPAFEECWRVYPRNVGKKAAYGKWRATIQKKLATGERRGAVMADLLKATKNYAMECVETNRPADMILHGATFFGPTERWVDYLKVPIEQPSGSSWPRWMNG